jgi:hypothetical protein
MKGRFSQHWTHVQNKHIDDDPDLDSEKQSGDRWLKRILHHLWTSLWQVWLLRNDDLHGRDKEEKERKRLDKLTPRIHVIYALKDRLLACDKPILDLPPSTRQAETSQSRIIDMVSTCLSHRQTRCCRR